MHLGSRQILAGCVIQRSKLSRIYLNKFHIKNYVSGVVKQLVTPVRGKKVQPCEVTKLKKKTTVGRLGFFCLFFPEGRIAPVWCRRVRSSQNHSLPLVSSLVDVCGVCSEMFAPSSLLFSLCQVQAVPATSCHRSPSPKQKAPWRLSSPDDQAGCSWLCS